MKTTAVGLAVGLSAVFVGLSGAAEPVHYDYITGGRDVSALTSAEHSPMVWTGRDTLVGAGDTSRQKWFLVGWSPAAGDARSRDVWMVHPAVFTLLVRYRSSGDSIGVAQLYDEIAVDPNGLSSDWWDGVYWNGDSSNWTIATGNYSQLRYGFQGGAFESIKAPVSGYSAGRVYTLNYLSGFYHRLTWVGWTAAAGAVADTTFIDWILVGDR